MPSDFPLLKMAAFGYRLPKPSVPPNMAQLLDHMSNSIDKPVSMRNKQTSPYQTTTNATADHTISSDSPMMKNASGTNNLGMSMLASSIKSAPNALAQAAPKIDNAFLSGKSMLNKSVTDSSLYSDSLKSGMNATQGFLGVTGQRHQPGLGAQLMGN
jgi:hypothetical protein